MAAAAAAASVTTMLTQLARRASTILLLGLLALGACSSPPPPAQHAHQAHAVRGALQFSSTVRNALLDAIESDTSTSAIMKIRSGTVEATCATADSGTVLATLSLPSDWMAAASSGSKAKSGTWQDTSADATGTAGHFRIYKSDGTTCQIQGTVTASGGGGDLTLDSTSITSGQTVTITTFTLTAPGAWLYNPPVDWMAGLEAGGRAHEGLAGELAEAQ